MKKYVTDTMAFVLHLEKRKMPENAKMPFTETEKGEAEMFIPAMVLVEIAYLSEKNRITISLSDIETHTNIHKNYRIYEIGMEVIQSTFEIDDINELHDRLIAGTAKLLELPLITNDPIIENSKFVKTIWK